MNFKVSILSIIYCLCINTVWGIGCFKCCGRGATTTQEEAYEMTDHRQINPAPGKRIEEPASSDVRSENLILYDPEQYNENEDYRAITDATIFVADRIKRSPTTQAMANETNYLNPTRLKSYIWETGEAKKVMQARQVILRKYLEENGSTPIYKELFFEYGIGNCGDQALACVEKLRSMNLDAKLATNEDHMVAFFNGILGDPWAGRVEFFRDARKIYGNDFTVRP